MAALLMVGVDMSGAFVVTNLPSNISITESRIVAYGPSADYRIEEGVSDGDIYVHAITPSGTVALFDSSYDFDTDIKEQLQSDFGVITSINEEAAAYPYITRRADSRIYGITEDKNLHLLEVPGAGFHNSIFRGKNLGEFATFDQWRAIEEGTFDDLYIGDYWLIDGLHYRIAAFDYYYGISDSDGNEVTTHHVVIVPDEVMKLMAMNPTRTSVGAYSYSDLRLNVNEGIPSLIPTVYAAFGSNHLLQFSQLFVYYLNGQRPGMTHFTQESTRLFLMSEVNVWGTKIASCSFDPAQDPGGVGYAGVYGYRSFDDMQYPLFRLEKRFAKSTQHYWLRDTSAEGTFCAVNVRGYGTAFYADENTIGIRPAFCLKGEEL